MSAIRDLVVASYLLHEAEPLSFDRDVFLTRRRQRDGSIKWAVYEGNSAPGFCLNKNGEWEHEPQPSERTDEFFARCRFGSPEEGLRAWETRKP